MQDQVGNFNVPFFSYGQIGFSSFLGTPLSAAFLVSLNILKRKRGLILPAAFFLFFAVAHISFAAMNPFDSTLANTLIFIMETLTIMAANHFLGLEGDGAESWVTVFVISMLFLIFWLFLIFNVFN